MKQFIDFIPLILFFIVYKLDPRNVELAGQAFELGGIFSATAVLIISSILVYGTLFLVQRRLEKGQWLTLVACLVFGGMTLAFHSETFLKWKAPVVNWLFALAFIGSRFIGRQTLLERMLGSQMELPARIWINLTFMWAIFFFVMGVVNLYVAFTFDENTWVNFKLFGGMGLMLVFVLAQGMMLSKHIEEEK